jgi:microsomal epoxide hydrolase
MLYWATGAIGSTFWPYYARLHEPWIVPDGDSVTVPTAYAEHPKEILTPRSPSPSPFTEISVAGHACRVAGISRRSSSLMR